MLRALNSQTDCRPASIAKSCTIDGIPAAAVCSSLSEEYTCIRERVALSNQNHYSKYEITGAEAVEFLSFINLPDIARLPIGKTASSFLLNEQGGVFCECYVVSSGKSYMLLTEGRTHDEVSAYLSEQSLNFDVNVHDVTDEVAMLQLDGPFAWELLKDLIGVKILGLRYLETLENQRIANVAVQIIRSGKSGEFGYSLLTPASDAAALWDELVRVGERYDLLPVGFDALDLCRLENRFPNVRIDCAKVANPLEMNCRVMFDREKDEHLGRSAIEALLATGPSRRIIGFTLVDDGDQVPELGTQVSLAGNTIGEVVNAGYSFTLKKVIGLALVASDIAYVGLQYQIGDAARVAETTSAPFIYNKSLEIRPQEHSFHAK